MCTAFLSGAKRTGGMFCARADSLDDGLISQTSAVRTRALEGEKRIVFPPGALFISFRRHWRIITAHRRITRISAMMPTVQFQSRQFAAGHIIGERPRNSSSARSRPTRSTRPISPISHIIRRSIDSYVDTPLRFFAKFAHDWSLFKASHRRRRSRNRNRMGLHGWGTLMYRVKERKDGKLTRSNGGSIRKILLFPLFGWLEI